MILPDRMNNSVLNLTNYDNAQPLTQPANYFYGDLMDYMWTDKICLTCFFIFLTFLSILLNHQFEFRQYLLGSRMRVACCSVMYRKILKLSKKTSEETTVGYVVNLLSNDVSRLNNALLLSYYIIVTPLQSVIICYILYTLIGPPAYIGVGCLLLKIIPVNSFLTKMSAKLRLKVAVRTDKRVGIMNELINGILVIKMYTWEKSFQAVVAKIRKLEIKQIQYASFMFGVCEMSFVVVERTTLFITLVSMLYFNIAITADTVFALSSFYNILELIVAVGFSEALSLLAEGLVSVKRIEQFLNLDEHDPTLYGVAKIENATILPNQPILEVKNVTATWTDTNHKTIDDVTFNAKPGKLCAIIGPVGSGKSSLLQLVLGELPLISGNVVVKGNVSYSSQEPWLFTGTVERNILFGQSYNKKRYDKVIKYCALTTDMQQLPFGDKTLVGERGISLSGGQKARISLARAVYKIADIYLFDDPLSAVDTNVGRDLYHQVIGPESYLAKIGATRILVTHQTHFLKDADWIIVIEDGRILQQGTYEEHTNNGLDFTKLLEPKHLVEEKEVEENSEGDCDMVPLMETRKGNGIITKSESSSTIDTMTKSIQSVYDAPENIVEFQGQGSVSFNVWFRYFQGGGTLCYLFYVTLFFLLSQTLSSLCDFFVNIWTEQEFLKANNQPTALTTNECLYIYTALIVGSIVFIMLRCYTFFIICMRASKTLHNNMFAAILHAPMRFFDTNSSGQILNRFSRDIGHMDELFPKSFFSSVQYLLKMLGIFIVVIAVNPMLIIVLGAAFILYILVTVVYIRAAQDLKRLEGIMRSPVLGHVSATLNGLTTIRVNTIQQKISKEFEELQNVHTNVWQLVHASNSTFGLWLDIISGTFVGCVVISFILFKENTFAGNVGLSLSQSLYLTGLVQYSIRKTTESIQLMTCVERILEYCDLKPEQSFKSKPSEKWPENGKIVFEDVSYSYDSTLPPVLKKLKIEINPGWKVGIVGRTGAGKSSLVGALFRFAHIDGQIKIDNIDTGEISLENLRRNIAIIPQDPVLFSATIRYNLDPFGLYTDEQLWTVLEEVELKNKIDHLEFLVTEGGCNFSVGQRQLICLARAILRNNKIFILDEATANVDPQTDKLIQKTIRVKFANCTVITIAHRLNTVMDADRIIVMDAGAVKEFDAPHILLQNQAGYLYDMVASTGENESKALRSIAAAAYTNHNKILEF